MNKPKTNKHQTNLFIGIVLTSSMILAAFTYSEKEEIEKELEKKAPVKIEYTLEKVKKPKEKKPITLPKKEQKQVTTSLKKDITSTVNKVTSNDSKTVESRSAVKGLNINFNPDPNYKIIDIDPIIVDFPDKEAEFIGGYAEMNKYIIHNLNLNKLHDIIDTDEILVHVEFIVSENGQIIDVKLNKSVDHELRIQIEELMKGMPLWTPAELKGRKVSSRIFLPIRIYFQ